MKHPAQLLTRDGDAGTGRSSMGSEAGGSPTHPSAWGVSLGSEDASLMVVGLRPFLETH